MYIETAAIVIHPPAYSSVSLGQTVQLTCVAYGYPIPNVTWKDISNNLDLSDKVIEKIVSTSSTQFLVSVLELCDVTPVQKGEYSCSADNGLAGPAIANQSVSFFLTVFEPVTGELYLKYITVCMYVCTYVCMYICMHLCIYVSMYICMYICMNIHL